MLQGKWRRACESCDFIRNWPGEVFRPAFAINCKLSFFFKVVTYIYVRRRPSESQVDKLAQPWTRKYEIWESFTGWGGSSALIQTCPWHIGESMINVAVKEDQWMKYVSGQIWRFLSVCTDVSRCNRKQCLVLEFSYVWHNKAEDGKDGARGEYLEYLWWLIIMYIVQCSCMQILGHFDT